jgi:hypothetical protein
MSFGLPRLASTLPHFVALLSLGLTAACGDKGGDDEGTGGTGGGAETLFAFDSTVEGFTFQDYTPSDPMYVNIFDVAPANATLSWDGGDGSDGEPGRAKLVMNFDDWNQLADIQVNFMGDDIQDWTGKVVKARVALEGGFSTNPSCPGGTYVFVKSTADYTWARGGTKTLEQMSLGSWQTIDILADVPAEIDTSNPEKSYLPEQILSVGIQFYSSSGGCDEKPTTVTAYVDTFTIEDAD